jgi:hypothetical protein
MYASYNKEDTNIYISGFCVLLQSIASAIGAFFGSFTADLIGYNWAFVSAGLSLIVFTIIYAVFVGAGDHIDDNEDGVTVAKEVVVITPPQEDVELAP